MIKKIIMFILKLFGFNREDNESNTSPTTPKLYCKKNLMTKTEIEFYNKIKDLEGYIIIPQINLASIIKKEGNNKYINELFKVIDFGVFNSNYEPLLLIELNDSTHNQINRKDRDLKVKKICNDANIKLINFYTNYPNEIEYVRNRIIQTINDSNK